ncbi:hypothetical protein SAMN05421803_1497 [Nocardiopsis flavescens]|uniref:Uncharacterized protein n=1 Tax=Nocardiopsis flavescens TaxID=758803 RepID=A0A1M6WQP3_9ACTN|nr:hypothetical protein [Nocardiopsis flavescens]SHK96090.1 hypothetical protein SAMN05421803_1497 [Nocardiopsis flavescens]
MYQIIPPPRGKHHAPRPLITDTALRGEDQGDGIAALVAIAHRQSSATARRAEAAPRYAPIPAHGRGLDAAERAELAEVIRRAVEAGAPVWRRG